MKGAGMLRLLLTVIVIAAAAWSGYWYVGATSLESAFSNWFEERRAEGWVADYTSLKVQGYPNRLDTVATGLALADPGTGLAWEAPQFEINALSYQPNHVIAVWPGQQLLATPQEKYHLSSDDMRASLVIAPDTTLQVERTALTAESLEIRPASGKGSTALQSLRLAAEHVPMADAATYRLGLAAEGFSPSLGWRDLVDPNGTLPDRFDALSADLTVEFRQTLGPQRDRDRPPSAPDDPPAPRGGPLGAAGTSGGGRSECGQRRTANRRNHHQGPQLA